ncbi:MAG: hypothetical protein A2V66_01650 [Ignavibacteria bacterium RBG_13_36_8]|nr:MAG: hypothetical protein A2V66_01650 [Ignavibacteria bacterium RBG_13_36_8]
MENFASSILVPVIVTILSGIATMLITHFVQRKKMRARITADLTMNFAKDNETFRKEVWDKYEKVSKKNEQLEHDLDCYKAKYDELLESYKKQEANYKEVLKKYGELEIKLKNVKDELDSTKKERDDLRTRVQKFGEENEDLRKELGKLRAIMNNMKEGRKKKLREGKN